MPPRKGGRSGFTGFSSTRPSCFPRRNTSDLRPAIFSSPTKSRPNLHTQQQAHPCKNDPTVGHQQADERNRPTDGRGEYKISKGGNKEDPVAKADGVPVVLSPTDRDLRSRRGRRSISKGGNRITEREKERQNGERAPQPRVDAKDKEGARALRQNSRARV